MKRLNKNIANKLSTIKNLVLPVRQFDQTDISVPETWLSVWNEFGVWQLVDSFYGAAKFAATGGQVIKEIADLAAHHCHDKQSWATMAAKVRNIISTTVTSDIDEETIAALTAAYDFAMAAATEKKQWALQACAAAAAARAYGWSAYAKSFSVDLIYKQISAETISAQMEEFLSLIASRQNAVQSVHRCAA
jgi:hypothetical protein